MFFTNIGDVSFLDEYVIIKKVGILIEYKDIKKMTYTTWKVRYGGCVYRLCFELHDHNRKYCYSLYNDTSPFVGDNSQFSHALKWVQTHRTPQDSNAPADSKENAHS